MDKQLFIKDLTNAIDTRIFPTVKLWNRLEARPRTDNFDRALKAEVRDALWMLTRQWQLGEFAGDDAGSPILAKVHLTTTRLTKYKVKDDPVEEFDNKLPFETKVEQQPVHLSWNKQTMHVDLRMMLGRRWLKLLAADPLLSGFVSDYKKNYAFVLPAQDKQNDYVYAHQQSWQQLAAISGERMMDGGKLYLHLKANNTNKASDGIAMSPVQETAVNNLAAAFALERSIKEAVARLSADKWDLAAALFAFHELRGWKWVGCDTLAEFLAQPEIGLRSTTYFDLVLLWRDLAVTRQLPVAELKQVGTSKASLVRRAIMRGKVDPQGVLSDAKTLGWRDLRIKYATPSARSSLDASTEPVRVRCPMCSTWVDQDRLPPDIDGTARSRGAT